jgi:hypothetical protein
VSRPTARGQTNLVAVTIALVVLTAVAGVAVVVADGALASADRDPGERRLAVGLSERLVSGAGPLTARGNVLNRSRVRTLDGDRLRALFPSTRGASVWVAVDGDPVATTGDATGGTTVRRVVLLQRRTATSVTPPLRTGTVTLPRRTPRVRLRVTPRSATVRTVRANGRVVLHDPDGLRGNYTVGVSRFETTRLTVDATGRLRRGDLRVTYFPARTTKAVLEVTVDE